MANQTRRVALTGGIAGGKSLVGEYLKSKGIPVIDADTVVHRLLREDAEIRERIRQEFGENIFLPDGAIDRKTLGAIVFNHPEKRKLLEGWIHPKTRQAIDRFYEEHKDMPVAVALIPLLFEGDDPHMARRYDEVWLLETDEATQVDRLMRSRNMSREEALARIRSQMPMRTKREMAQSLEHCRIIRNDADPASLYRQIDGILASS